MYMMYYIPLGHKPRYTPAPSYPILLLLHIHRIDEPDDNGRRIFAQASNPGEHTSFIFIIDHACMQDSIIGPAINDTTSARTKVQNREAVQMIIVLDDGHADWHYPMHACMHVWHFPGKRQISYHLGYHSHNSQG